MVGNAVAPARQIGKPFGFEGHGRTIRFRLLHVFEFADNRISRESGGLDLPAIIQQLS